MKRTRPSKWRETNRSVLGLYMSGHVSGPGRSNPGCYCAVYQVTEMRDVGNSAEFRERVEYGTDIRDYGEGYDALASLHKQYMDKCIAADGKSRTKP